jgi:indole-3-glycerol phosphate synthase
MSILLEITADVLARVEERRRTTPLAELKSRVRDAEPTRSLVDALTTHPFSVIAEHKKRSPSGGRMSAENCARAFSIYARTPWISAISVLTEEDHFDGSLADLTEGRAVTGKPVLRKDFLVEEYQVWEARAFGADAILLMTALHLKDPRRMEELYFLAREVSLDVLFEIGMDHGDPDALASIVPSEARVWGINARRFSLIDGARQSTETRDHTTDTVRHQTLRRFIPPGKIAVAESGILTVDELRRARDDGYRAALVGTAFVKGPKPIEHVVEELRTAFEGADPDSERRESGRS